MKVIKANKAHKIHVLKLLDDFRTNCAWIINSEGNYVSNSAIKSGGNIFDEIIDSNNSAIFLLEESNDYVGIATVHKIPQIRKGCYCAEIEEMFVSNEYQGRGLGQLLIDEIINWSIKNDIKVIRLESSNQLKNAHKFYSKVGFENYGKAFEKRL